MIIPKKTILLIFTFLINTLVICQDNEIDQIKFHSISYGFGFFDANINQEFGGVYITLDANISYKKNIIKVSYLNGTEVGNFLLGSNYNFNQYNILYGRELKVATWFGLEGFFGIGLYNQKSKKITINNGNTVAIPIVLNFKFFPKKRFTFGFSNQYNINNFNNIYGLNLVFTHKFR